MQTLIGTAGMKPQDYAVVLPMSKRVLLILRSIISRKTMILFVKMLLYVFNFTKQNCQ